MDLEHVEKVYVLTEYYSVFYRDESDLFVYEAQFSDRNSALSFAEDLRHKLILEGVSFLSVVVIHDSISSETVLDLPAKPIRLKDFQKDWETFKQNSHFV